MVGKNTIPSSTLISTLLCHMAVAFNLAAQHEEPVIAGQQGVSAFDAGPDLRALAFSGDDDQRVAPGLDPVGVPFFDVDHAEPVPTGQAGVALGAGAGRL